VLFTTAAIQSRLQYAAGDTIGLFLPLSFDYGLYQLFLALHARASLFIGDTGPGLPLRLAGELEAAEVSILPGMPSLLAALVQVLRRAPRPLPRLRAVTSTGERLPAGTIASLRQLLPEVRV
jgi:long-chain acyl-CoA synthetase